MNFSIILLAALCVQVICQHTTNNEESATIESILRRLVGIMSSYAEDLKNKSTGNNFKISSAEVPLTSDTNTFPASTNPNGTMVPSTTMNFFAYGTPVDVDTIDAAFVLENSPFTCKGFANDYYADIHFDCKFFHHCQFFFGSDGKLFVKQATFKCVNGTKFNQPFRTCDWAEKVVCNPTPKEDIKLESFHRAISSTTKAPSITIKAPSVSSTKAQSVSSTIESPSVSSITKDPSVSSTKATTKLTIPESSFWCIPEFHKEGSFYAEENTGCKFYHRCSYSMQDGSLFVKQESFLCPENKSFDQRKMFCLDSDSVNCSKSQVE